MEKFRDWKDIPYDECKDEPLNEAFVYREKEKEKPTLQK